jgi:hypothetical protein
MIRNGMISKIIYKTRFLFLIWSVISCVRGEFLYEPVHTLVEAQSSYSTALVNGPVSIFYLGKPQNITDIFLGGRIGQILLVRQN